ncbi:Web family protein [Thalictrum thalictroides]|uniref:Web family protein n=1 Tax=Thalictrum thalictroides TaxID=46969 RepID=A0A7J6W6R5_THATH|nr:Web family protein [Thalictrum thalictroides]
MLSSKTKTGLSEAIPNKTSPATPRGSKLAKGAAKSNPDSPSPQQNSRLSIDRSPKTVDSKPASERRSPRTTITPDKQPTRIAKGSELQAQLNQVQEDLKKTKELLANVEKEKEKALAELKEAKKLAEEASDKVGEALVAQKRAEETVEIEKFRADELEQVGIEATQKREDEWLKKIDDVRNQHAMDVSALLSTTEELQRVKHELAMTSDAKNQALSHADDATKIAEIHAEKVEMLSAELYRVKALLDSNQEMKNSESTELIKELNTEVGSLKVELEKAKAAETQMAEAESLINQLKQELETAKTAETKIAEAETQIEQLKQELQKAKAAETERAEAEILIEQLNQELQRAKVYEAKVAEAELLTEQLKNEIQTVKKAESDACILAEEWRMKAENFEIRVREANQLEKSASESLATFMEQLEGKSGLLQESEAEVASLQAKVETLEMSIGRQRRDLEESVEHLNKAKHEASEKARLVESLTSELETVKEEKVQALNNEKLAASSVQGLLEEKNKLINELDASREEEDKSKKAMESLASALHEVSSEVREAKEKLLPTQTELENAKAQVEDLKLVLEATNEKYENLLDEAKHEIKLLTEDIQQSSLELENSKNIWDQRELSFTSSIKNSEEEFSYLRKESDRLTILLKEAEEEAQFAKKECSRLQDITKEADSEVLLLKGVVEEVKHESMMLKEKVLDNEDKLQHITQENEELRLREATALEKATQLSKLLEEALTKKESEENGELSSSEKDYDMLPSVVEFSEENGIGREEPKSIVEIPSQQVNEPQPHKDLLEDLVESLGPKVENGSGNRKQEDGDSTVEVVEPKMWESCKIGEKDLLPEKEPEPESFEEEVDSKADDDSFEQQNGLSSTETVENGGTSPIKQQSQKKKKPLLHKFGSLLKKSSTKSK